MTSTSLKDRINTLSQTSKKLFLLRLEQAILSKRVQSQNKGQNRLVAYVKGKNEIDIELLKSYLEEHLPAYMIPSSIIPLNEIPTLPNGKIDKIALSKLSTKTANKPKQGVQALSEIEAKLKAIWEEILNFSPIDVHDNFFEIGGDSILSIQIIAKSRKEGISIAPNQLFEHQTISELALFVSEEQNESAVKEIIVGEVQLTPIQNWFFDTHKNAPHYWNQAVKISGELINDRSKLEKSIAILVEKHEGLRLAFRLKNERWTAEAINPQNNYTFEFFDFSEISIENIEQKLELILVDTQNNFQLDQGNLFKCLYFDFGSIRENHCVLLAHHLVIDAVSWNILIEKLHECLKRTEYENIKNKLISNFSLKNWTDYLLEMNKSSFYDEELEFWKKQAEGLKPFPKDMNENLPILEREVERIDFTIAFDETTKLLSVNDVFKTKTDELLIAALHLVISEFLHGEDVVIGLERHGRELEDMSKDPSGVVGWLTSYFPIKLKSNKNQLDIGSHIKIIKETLRSVPNGGIGYGILKYLKGTLSNEPLPEVVFNYLGNQNALLFNTNFSVKPIQNRLRHELSERYYQFEINSFLKEGKLNFSWSYGRNSYKKQTVEKIISKFKNVITEISEYKSDVGLNYTPSDFPEAELNQDDLDNLLNSLE